MRKLAIIIPAYKIDYFKETLESLANQTCKDFTVYIGDDCSSADFKSLILKYMDKLNIIYHRFQENLGGRDLVGHWKRCVELTQGEPWLWLFSDDDVIGERCVELFYEEIACEAKYDIYHFDVKVINSDGKIVNTPKAYPSTFDAIDFYKQKATGKIESFVVENLFSREIYNHIGGFVEFDMAWGSDTATWISMSFQRGMRRIDGDNVFWRRSNLNITPQNSRQMCIRKLEANIEYFCWANSLFKDSRSAKICNSYYLFRRIVYYSNSLKFDDYSFLLTEARRRGLVDMIQHVTMTMLYPLIKLYKLIMQK